MSPLVNGNAASPPTGSTAVKSYITNFVPKSSLVNTKGISSSVGHSGTNHGQTVVFANTNISQLQGQPISQSLTATQIAQGMQSCSILIDSNFYEFFCLPSLRFTNCGNSFNFMPIFSKTCSFREPN